MKGRIYYFYIDCSPDQRIVAINANKTGWYTLKDLLDELLISENNKSSIAFSDKIINYENSNKNDFIPINQFNITLDNNLGNINVPYLRMESNLSSSSVFLIGNKKGLYDLLDSINCLINSKEKFPIDISHMVPEWGGQGLLLDSPVKGNAPVFHLRLYRWQ